MLFNLNKVNEGKSGAIKKVSYDKKGFRKEESG
jgi:hypothetical protein